jgi:hypothetical protein
MIPKLLELPSFDLAPCTKKMPCICGLDHTAVIAAMRKYFGASNHATLRCGQSEKAF